MCASRDEEALSAAPSIENVSRTVLPHVVDVHCHPTDSATTAADIEELPIRVCAMATRKSDQALVAKLADGYPDKVIPCFGYHPWFSHIISLEPVPETPEAKEAHYRSLLLSKDESRANRLDAFAEALPVLPHPSPLAFILEDLRQNITRFIDLHNSEPSHRPKPMLGEVGLDRSFRIPIEALREPPEAKGGRPRLTPFNVPVEHQLAILEAQIGLAVEFGLNVSLHSVQAQAQTLELFARMNAKYGARFDAISVDMHSCGVSVETWLNLEKKHPNVFLSLSTGINGRTPLHRELIKASSPDRILVESDIHELKQTAGRSWAMLQVVAEVKEWFIEDAWSDNGDADAFQNDGEENTGAVRRLEANWKRFEQGGHKRPPLKQPRKSRKKAKEFHSEDEGKKV